MIALVALIVPACTMISDPEVAAKIGEAAVDDAGRGDTGAADSGTEDSRNADTGDSAMDSAAEIDADGDRYLSGEDCDDTDPTVHPGAVEVCNEVDDDCDGETDEGLPLSTYYRDGDGDGYGDAGMSTAACGQPEGYATAPDCDDGDPLVNPGAPEACNGADDDCDSEIDEDVTTTYYADVDGDGYGDATSTVEACDVPAGHVVATAILDCDDGAANLHPFDDDGDGADDSCGWRAVSTAYTTACAVDSDGAATCWGQDGATMMSYFPGNYVDIDLGWLTGCALDTTGAVDCYGVNGVPSGSGYTELSFAGSGGVLLDSAGVVSGFGSDSSNSNLVSSYLTSAALSTTWDEVRWAGYEGVGITGGALDGWNPTFLSDPPVGTFTRIEATTTLACALDTVGDLTCWGYSADSKASTLPSGTGYTDLSVGVEVCALTATGAIECSGELSGVPSGSFRELSGGGEGAFDCAITTDGAIECWGNNDDYGQISGAP